MITFKRYLLTVCNSDGVVEKIYSYDNLPIAKHCIMSMFKYNRGIKSMSIYDTDKNYTVSSIYPSKNILEANKNTFKGLYI